MGTQNIDATPPQEGGTESKRELCHHVRRSIIRTQEAWKEEIRSQTLLEEAAKARPLAGEQSGNQGGRYS